MTSKLNPTLNPDWPAAIEAKLIYLGKRISSEPVKQLAHDQQAQLPEWRGADVHVTSDFAFEPKDFIEQHDLLVRTPHAKALTWLFFELRDAFAGCLDAGNKYGFYGALAQAALDHLAAHQPEPDEAKQLLKAVLAEAFLCLQRLREDGTLDADVPIVLHKRDAEGGQSCINLGDGQSCLSSEI